jgi:hypothetical protein
LEDYTGNRKVHIKPDLTWKSCDNVNRIEVVQNYVKGLSLILVTLNLIRFLHQRGSPHKVKAVKPQFKTKNLVALIKLHIFNFSE